MNIIRVGIDLSTNDISMKFLLLSILTLFFITPSLYAQHENIITDSDWCNESNNWGSDKHRHCEVREITIESRAELVVDGGLNGGISIQGWDKDEIQILAQVSVYTNKNGGSNEIAKEVSIKTGSIIKASVPSLKNQESVSVSYRIYVPNNIDLDLDAYNGGISIANIDGNISFETLNGGIVLNNLSGSVKGETSNGGIKVELTGFEWIGKGLDVETTNGGIALSIPKNYNALLKTGTVNGSLDFDFPMLVSGRFDKNLTTTLGNGGKTIRVVTTNGGVKIKNASNRASSN